MKILTALLLITVFSVINGCSNEIVPDREYQKQAAQKSDKQLDKEVEKFNK